MEQFLVMDRHVEAAPGAAGSGSVVLSRLPPGHSLLNACRPSLKLVLEGEQHYVIDGRTIAVGPGQYLYLDAGSQFVAHNRRQTTGLCLGIGPAGPAGAAGAGHDPVLGRALVLSTQGSAMGRSLDRYARQIVQDPALGQSLAAAMLAQAGAAIAAPLARSRTAVDALKAAKPSTRRELFRRLERARGFLHDHDDRTVTLAQMAAVAGLSQFHLARYFKDAFGAAPIAYHRSLRLARAARLLAAGNSVAKAAAASGYSDEVALSHAFRRKYGAPPHLWTLARRAS